MLRRSRSCWSVRACKTASHEVSADNADHSSSRILVSGEKKSPADRLRDVIDKAVLAEELGFDGFAVGERHEDPFISSSPPVVLSNIAARTSKIGLFTAVTTLSLLDPVRAFEDYSTLDNLSGGRLELIIGKGNGAAQAELFHVTTADQWDRNREGYELFRLLVAQRARDVVGPIPPATRQRQGTAPAAAGPHPNLARQRDEQGFRRSRRSLRRPDLFGQRQQPHRALRRTGSSLPAAVGVLRPRDPRTPWSAPEPPVSTSPRSPRRRWPRLGPTFEARLAFARRAGIPMLFESIEDFVERSSALIGSPAQVIDKVGRYHDQLGHEVMHLSADNDGVTVDQQRRSLELFQSDVAPVLRQHIPSRPLVSQMRRIMLLYRVFALSAREG